MPKNKRKLVIPVDGRMDAGESIFFQRELEVIRPQSYDVKYEELLARTLIPVNNQDDPGAELVTYQQYDQYGVAKIIANYADDFPASDVSAKEFSVRIKGVGSSYRYNLQEIRAAKKAGKSLDARKATAARRAIEEKLEAIAKTGDSGTGLLGFLNQPNAQTYTVPADGTGASALWANKTGDQIARDMFAIGNQIVEVTKQREIPTTLVLPLTRYHVIATKRMDANGADMTVLAYFLSKSLYIKEVIGWSGLETAGAGSTARMVAYKRSPEALELLIPQEFEQFDPERQNLSWKTPCHMRTGGVLMFYPLSMAYGDGI